MKKIWLEAIAYSVISPCGRRIASVSYIFFTFLCTGIYIKRENIPFPTHPASNEGLKKVSSHKNGTDHVLYGSLTLVSIYCDSCFTGGGEVLYPL